MCLLYILRVVAIAEEAVQHKDATWEDREQAIRRLVSCLAATDKSPEPLRSNSVINKYYYGHHVVSPLLVQATQEVDLIRQAIGKQVATRFANSKYLVCVANLVDSNQRPDRISATLDSFGNEDMKTLAVRWAKRLHRHGVAAGDIVKEWCRVKELYVNTDVKPGAATVKAAVVQKCIFPTFHVFGCMLLAITPSNAAVEWLSSRLRRVLTEGQCNLSGQHAEDQLVPLIDADASDASPKYDEVIRQ